MSRSDQIIGLCERAKKLLEAKEELFYTETITRIYPDGSQETIGPRPVNGSPVKCELSGEKFYGMFDIEYDLHRYILPDGRIYVEFVQEEPWSSGPCFFLALKGPNGETVEESLWREEEIGREIGV